MPEPARQAERIRILLFRPDSAVTRRHPGGFRKLAMSKEEEYKIRYARQRALPGIGAEGQKRLTEGSVAVVGCGALGSLCAMYLAGAGIGRIAIFDFDTIDISNLQRQLFFSTEEAGLSKAVILEKRMRALNPGIEVVRHECLINASNAAELLEGYDFIVEATDNPATKYLIDEISEQLSIGCCIGGVREFSGQVTTCMPGGTRYSDIFPERPDAGGFTPCGLGGVLGPAAGTVASIQASEAIKHISGCGSLLDSRILTFDLLDDTVSVLDI